MPPSYVTTTVTPGLSRRRHHPRRPVIHLSQFWSMTAAVALLTKNILVTLGAGYPVRIAGLRRHDADLSRIRKAQDHSPPTRAGPLATSNVTGNTGTRGGAQAHRFAVSWSGIASN